MGEKVDVVLSRDVGGGNKALVTRDETISPVERPRNAEETFFLRFGERKLNISVTVEVIGSFLSLTSVMFYGYQRVYIRVASP